MLLDICNSLFMIFLIIDGVVEDDRYICDIIKSYLFNWKLICLCIYIFGIGK